MKTNTIVLISILSVLLFVQEQVLSLLPNVQLTVLLLVVYTKTVGTKNTLIIVVIHSVLDTMLMGNMNFLYTPFLIVGWGFTPLLLGTVFKKVKTPIGLAFLGILFSFLYSWVFLIPGTILQESPLFEYFLADVGFEILLALSSFVTILWLYTPLARAIERIKGETM